MARSAGTDGSTQPDHHGVEPGDRAGSGEVPAGAATEDTSRSRPISIVTEVWTSTELKTIISSKRNDPRMGEQTFRLTNIVRVEPDPSLFTVPSDFKIVDGGPKTILYRRSQ
jgi:hypothetical protein